MVVRQGPKEILILHVIDRRLVNRVLRLLHGYKGNNYPKYRHFKIAYPYLIWDGDSLELWKTTKNHDGVHCHDIDKFLSYFNTNKIYELWL